MKNERTVRNNTEQTHFSVAAAESLPFANESFDKILGISVLEHFQDGRQALQEAFRCLEPGGVLALTTDSFSLGEIWQGTQKRHAERFSVCHYYSKSELQDAVAQAGYLPLRVEPILRHRFTGFFFEWSIWTNGVKSLAFVLLPLMQVVEYFWGSQEAGYMMMICAQKPKHC
jgi:ubiquinone/menaquinone biosynthesis C-methylase UbiE